MAGAPPHLLARFAGLPLHKRFKVLERLACLHAKGLAPASCELDVVRNAVINLDRLGIEPIVHRDEHGRLRARALCAERVVGRLCDTHVHGGTCFLCVHAKKGKSKKKSVPYGLQAKIGSSRSEMYHRDIEMYHSRSRSDRWRQRSAVALCRFAHYAWARPALSLPHL